MLPPMRSFLFFAVCTFVLLNLCNGHYCAYGRYLENSADKHWNLSNLELVTGQYCSVYFQQQCKVFLAAHTPTFPDEHFQADARWAADKKQMHDLDNCTFSDSPRIQLPSNKTTTCLYTRDAFKVIYKDGNWTDSSWLEYRDEDLCALTFAVDGCQLQIQYFANENSFQSVENCIETSPGVVTCLCFNDYLCNANIPHWAEKAKAVNKNLNNCTWVIAHDYPKPHKITTMTSKLPAAIPTETRKKKVTTEEPTPAAPKQAATTAPTEDDKKNESRFMGTVFTTVILAVLAVM